MLKFHLDILREFEPVGRRAKVILFGSVARGDYRLDSDIDLAVVTGDESLVRLALSIADRVLLEYGKVVSLKFIEEGDFAERRSWFMDEILRGIVIYDGGRHESSYKGRA